MAYYKTSLARIIPSIERCFTLRRFSVRIPVRSTGPCAPLFALIGCPGQRKVCQHNQALTRQMVDKARELLSFFSGHPRKDSARKQWENGNKRSPG
jgi:hypothetical protein